MLLDQDSNDGLGSLGGDEPEWEMQGIRVPRELIQGTVMKKLSDKGKAIKERLFRLDANQGRMYWISRKRGVSEFIFPNHSLRVNDLLTFA
jgi:hypothetical protein